MEPQPPVPIHPGQNQHLLADDVPWSTWDAWMGVAFLGAWIVINLILSVLLLLSNLDAISGIILALSELLLFIPVWWYVFHNKHAGWKELGFRSFTWKDMRITLGALVGIYAFMLCYGLVLSQLHLEPDVNWVEVFQNQAAPGWLIAIAVVIAPFLEEILFRGFIFPGFSKKYGWVGAMLITAVMFAVIHFQIVNLILFFVLGCILAYLRHTSKSLWPSILVHLLVNGISVGLTYILAASPPG